MKWFGAWHSLANRLSADLFFQQVKGMIFLTVIGQGLYLVAGPFIGRIYSPQQMGVFGLFFTIWVLVSVFSCGLYDQAIPAADDDGEARLLGGASIMIGMPIALISGIGIAAASKLDLLGLGALPAWAGILMFLGMVAQMAVLLGQAWAIRSDDVLRIGRSNVLMNGMRGVFQIAGGLVMPLWGTLAASEFVARLAQAISLFRCRSSSKWRVVQRGEIGQVVSKYRRFPLVFGPALAIDSLAMFLQTAMLGVLFGAAEMGQYFLMRRTLDIPVAFAFRSLADVFFAKQIALAREAPHLMRPFFLRSSIALAALGVIGFSPLLVWGAELFQMFFGQSWGLAGTLAAIMVPATIANLAVAPVSKVFLISKRAHLRLAPAIANLAGTLVVFYLATVYEFSIEQTVIGTSLAITVQYAIYFMVGFLAAGDMTTAHANSTSST